ncbi:ATP-dependent DNA helicase PcrA [bioreactor metagenome]|uniref:DNA 3'-5' helicase n=1 Tax=bioreactor metagenome TaxID=1076179 RepID=A0A644WV37_9ZZZZ|nr:ATP-dependent helicase [Rikenellaceae bacterium]
MSKVNLSEKQNNIVQLDQGAFLVLASAGSGKTRVLTERVKRLSESSTGKILAITFTNKAAAEIKERLGSSDKINKNVFIGTFHSFCQSILELRFKLLGYKKMPHIFDEDSDRIELIKEAIESIPYYKEIYDDLDSKQKNQYTYNALQFISTVKRELISPDELVEESEDEELKYLFKNYQDLLRSNNAIDFDDIIKLVYDLFTNNEAVASLYRKAYSFICIDECQDLNKLQYFLLKSICGETVKNVMMVGDPNQSIYGFNGSTSTFMQQDFINDFNATVIELDENYRCSRAVIEASNILMDLDVEAKNYVIDGVFSIEALATDAEEAEYVLQKINELIELKNHPDIEGEITYERITILARNKFVFKNIEGLLTSENIPFYYKSGNSGLKFSSSSMKIFDLYFRIKINPLDRLHQKKLSDFLKVVDAQDSEELQKSDYPISLKIKKIVDEISMENIHLKIEALKEIFNDDVSNDDERKLTLDELADFNNQLIEYKKQNIKTTLEGFKAAITLGLTKNNKIKESGVCLSTVHTMKGQESEIVFLIGMDDGTFPDYRAINKGGEELNQEKNNTYVAFTRAKRFLFVTYPEKRMMPWGDYKPRQISRFLNPLV